MKTQYYVASTLDGFIATESDSLDWLFPLGSVQESSYPEFIKGVGALAMGAATYWEMRRRLLRRPGRRGHMRSQCGYLRIVVCRLFRALMSPSRKVK